MNLYLDKQEHSNIELMALEVVNCAGGSLGTVYAAMRDAYIMGRERISYFRLQELQAKAREKWNRERPDDEVMF